jgi:hypothetical protein
VKYAILDLDTANPTPVADLQAYAAAQQRQLREHYAACFDGDGEADEVRVITDKSQLSAGEMLCQLEDQPPPGVTGELGEHDFMVLHVYKGLCAQSGVSWQSCMSHEILESRNDFRLHACVELDDGSIWDREICDRVESLSYQIDGVEVSNFNTPECFEPPPAGVTPARVTAGVGGLYDWMGSSSSPNQVLSGGYAQQYTPGRGWQQKGTMRPYRQTLADAKLSRNSLRQARAA